MNTLTISESSVPGPIGRVKSWLSSRAAMVATARRRHQTYRVLSSLDDRTLHDIGLHRTMLLSVAVHGIRTLNDVAPPVPAGGERLAAHVSGSWRTENT